mgnify:CR=1 FL=1
MRGSRQCSDPERRSQTLLRRARTGDPALLRPRIDVPGLVETLDGSGKPWCEVGYSSVNLVEGHHLVDTSLERKQAGEA